MNIHYKLIEQQLNSIGRNLQDIDSHEDGSFIKSSYDSAVFKFIKTIDFPDHVIESEDDEIDFFYSIYPCYLYQKAGQKNFHITDGLFQQLAYTKLTGAPLSDLQIPFQTIYLSFPETLPFYDCDSEPVLGAYVSLFNDETCIFHKLLYIFYVYGVDKPSVVLLFFAYLPGDDLMKSFYKQVKESGFEPKQIEFCEKLYEIVINTLLYLTTKRDSVARKTPTTSKRRRKNKSNNYIVGNKIMINNNMPRIVYTDKENSERYTKRIAKWIVRGHWRNQAYGKDLSKRKLIWIEPFVKGEGASDAINKDFEVK